MQTAASAMVVPVARWAVEVHQMAAGDMRRVDVYQEAPVVVVGRTDVPVEDPAELQQLRRWRKDSGVEAAVDSAIGDSEGVERKPPQREKLHSSLRDLVTVDFARN